MLALFVVSYPACAFVVDCASPVSHPVGVTPRLQWSPTSTVIGSWIWLLLVVSFVCVWSISLL